MQEEFCMEQPQGYVDAEKPNCKFLLKIENL
jgi:hypothetical protein